ncbi:hypothetical protein SLEP1_g52315 [Rubroshorea leprosula]|uniref:NB-ARC domain-containing protein n=1 Tax=Rubroshorea leprosula TaxID=152421 RepID=A0AAV5M9M4_9ROSI|nr:hypothetical protein SLEP1_g52315 [Rubroshorea leprosula]
MSSFQRDAEEKQRAVNSIKTWLDDLKDLAYDMEDILEEFTSNGLRSSVIAEPQCASTTSRCIPACFSYFKHSDSMFDSNTISKVKAISNRLLSMTEGSNILGLLSLTMQAGERPDKVDVARVPTSSLPDSHVYGRETDKVAVLQKLLNNESSSQGYSVIPIVGMGGIGKTTSAQNVYNEVGQGSFELKAWVCVSDRFDVLGITRSILEAVSRVQHDLRDLNLLQEELKEKLSSKKFLLVLDDVWNEGYRQWDTLQKPFQSGSAGSKIVVTTRSKRVAEIMGGNDRIHYLKELDYKQCLSIFARHALGEDNFDAHPCLKEVGEEIVKRCNGSPLVAKVLGGLLRRKHGFEDWKFILNKMLNLQEVKSEILPSLMLSYHHLPSHLKQCFSYCAVFPKDYEFDKEELVLLWMAEGLLREENQLEEIGQRYFLELLSRSFFQQSTKNKLRYVMHDLIHDLAEFVAGRTCYNLDLEDMSENFSQLKGELSILDLHNVSHAHDAKKASLDKIDGLDWLLLQWTSEFGNSRNEDKVMEVLSWLKPHLKLKSLSIICYGGKEFPSWISCPSFSNLSYLKLCQCRRSTSLPSLGQLPTLKELIVEGMDAIETVDSKFYGHGTFQCLEKLEFRDMLVWEEWTSTTGDGVGFSCLRELVIENCPKLIGQLPSQLADVINLVIRRCLELRCPSSMSLQSLQKLNIEDCNVAVLNSLVDLVSLTSLEIERISGLVCLARSFIESLIVVEKVKIKKCLELTCLWEEGAKIENLAHLEKMNIESCPLLVSLTGKEHGLLPSNLKHLTLSRCKALESLTDAMMMKVDGSSSSNNMLRLESLSIYNYGVLLQDNGDSNSNLESLTIEQLPSLNSVGSGHLPASLKEFTVEDWKRLESFPERMLQHCTELESLRIGDCEVLRSLSLDGLSNLRDLNIVRCAVLEFFPKIGLSLPNLRSLTIIGWPGLERIPDGGFPPNLTDLYLDGEHLKQPTVERGLRNLISLQNVGISNTCPPPDIVLPPSLIFLWIVNAKNLKSIPRGLLQNLNSLRYLEICDCPKLRSLPREGLPPSLVSLCISKCPLLKRQCFEEKREYWSLTRTIPLVQMDDDEVKTYTQTHTLM